MGCMDKKNDKAAAQEKKRQSGTLIGSTQANREYKASVFEDVMGMREAALELYFALKNVRLPEDTPVEVITLRDVMYLGQINDVGFLIGNIVIFLMEHQSSQSPNLPIRILIYLGREYEKILSKNNRELYSSTLLQIPRPEFYVLYNGKTRLKDDSGNIVDFRTYKLSDAFLDAPEGDTAFQGCVELEVPVYDINDGHNTEILERSARLRQYAKLIAKIREFESQGRELQEAIKLAVDYCISNDILREYLQDRASEVLSMLFDELRVEDLRDVWFRDGKLEGKLEGRLEGKLEGKLEGRLEGKLDDITDMYNDGVAVQQIAKWKKMSESDIKKVLNQRLKAKA